MTGGNRRTPGAIAQLSFSDSWGGLEKSALDWTARFRDIGRDSICICAAGSPLGDRLAKTDLDTITLPRPNRYFAPRCVRRLRALLRERDVRALFVHSSKDLWLATQAIELERTRVLYFNRMINSTVMKRDLVHRMIYGKVEHVIALSREAKCGLLHTTTIPARGISVIPDCIDPGEFRATAEEGAATRRKFGIGERSFLVLAVGRLDPKKGQWELVQAIASLAAKGLDVSLLIVGARTKNEHHHYEKQLHRYVACCGLGDRIRFAGHQDRVAPFYRAADAFVLPSHAETFGLVLLEAMLFEVPVIATNRGAVPEILTDERSGLLIEPQTPRFVADAVERLYTDSTLRARIGAAGGARVRSTYLADIVARRVEGIARHALRHAPRSRPFRRTFLSWIRERFVPCPTVSSSLHDRGVSLDDEPTEPRARSRTPGGES